MNVASDIAFSLVLALATVLAALVTQPAGTMARRYLRFAAAVYGALAVCDALAGISATPWYTALATTMAMFAAAAAPAAMTLAIATAFEGALRSLFSVPALLLACLAGMLSAATGAAFIAFSALFAAVCAMLALGLRHRRQRTSASIQTCISAFALLAGAACLAGDEAHRTAFALFSAAALLGAALSVTNRSDAVVEQQIGPAMPRARIGRHR